MKPFDSLRAGLASSFDEVKSFDWNDIGDPESIGVWPGPVKALLAVLLFAACLGAGYWFHIKGRQAELAVAEAGWPYRPDLTDRPDRPAVPDPPQLPGQHDPVIAPGKPRQQPQREPQPEREHPNDRPDEERIVDDEDEIRDPGLRGTEQSNPPKQGDQDY